MDLKRLFHVLVVGGAVAAGCERSRTSGLVVADGGGAADLGMPDSGAPEAPAAAEDAAAEASAAEDAAAAEVSSVDVGVTMDAAAANDASDGPRGNPCFCSSTMCCDVHDGTPATVQAGLYCCWSTKC